MAMTVKLKVWRQAGPGSAGRLVDYVANNVHADMSFLEMLDVVNEDLIRKGEDPIAFDSDCREGICGSCGLVIDGVAHGPDKGATTCQVHMRRFKSGRSEEHTSELQSQSNLVCRLLLEKKKKKKKKNKNY